MAGEYRYTESHEWVRFEEDGTAYVGISDYAQTTMGDIVFVGLPEPEEEVTAGEVFGDIESVKSVSDLISPVTGVILEVNDQLTEEPEQVNAAPRDAWFIHVGSITDQAEFMDEESYRTFTEEA